MTLALQTSGLTKSFGSLKVTQSVDFALPAGARHALIGPNGAGKTTFINLLTGALPASAGRIDLLGEDITSLRPDQRVKRGLVRTFQINSLFPQLTPHQSVTLAICERDGVTGQWWRRTGAYTAALDEASAILAQLRLTAVAHTPTRMLPYGQQRILEVAVSLALRPRVLLLDEPAAGIPSSESAELFEVIGNLPADMALLFIEHDMHLVFRFATRITVLVAGAVMAEGTPEDISANPDVKTVYLGKGGRR
ncbi:ABC transporter ATP-binding protein [Pigmentiphaga litoralis]|uniref:ABC-type branched-subunit amino acid transport system ATPase component n=1 Tax=Pigmentiphaga litoralis TaxID=516702 RepID=A0A7Y9IV21_9BURK|nr:ABC transporter ATP-binding protein [Pigmentiphaga litoralis]NYE23353.1 branched-chain amino acid transport system ATP-binding protein [Pigmentiphaga litoralis]NYE83033.1 ABC-type branched-subunit amino acid transport system ATPase component [Pigmentiphaga litoralis]